MTQYIVQLYIINKMLSLSNIENAYSYTLKVKTETKRDLQKNG